MLGHGIEGDVLSSQREGDEETTVLAGNKSSGHRKEEPHCSTQQEQGEHYCCELMPQDFFERVIVHAVHTWKAAFEHAVNNAVPRTVVDAQKAAAQHWSQRERDES